MELTNEFRVGVPPTHAWEVLNDVERIGPCMPGAQLQEVEGEEYRGIVKVKVGPITAQYKGKATFVERKQDEGVLILRAEGRDTRGQGNANATITARLQPDGEGTRVTVTTDLNVTGKVAQFGRGFLADVSSKLLGQFVDCLESNVLGEAPPPPPPPPAAEQLTVSGTGPSAPPLSATGVTAPPAPAPEASTGSIAPTAGHNGKGDDREASPRDQESPPAATAATGEAATIRRIHHAPNEPVDLLEAAGGSVAKRLIPVGLVALLLFLLLRRRRRRS